MCDSDNYEIVLIEVGLGVLYFSGLVFFFFGGFWGWCEEFLYFRGRFLKYIVVDY